MGHFFSYFFLPEVSSILIISFNFLLNIPRIVDAKFVLDSVPLSFGSRYFGYPNVILAILGEETCPLPLGRVKEIIIYCI